VSLDKDTLLRVMAAAVRIRQAQKDPAMRDELLERGAADLDLVADRLRSKLKAAGEL
jgi:hypothetical protein